MSNTITSRLGRKQNTKNEDWLWTMENIEKLRTRKEIEDLVHKTVEDINRKTKGKKAGYGWSGGKDSIALQLVCDMAGIKLSVHAKTEELEYPAFAKWVDQHKPKGCEIYSTPQTMDWLVKNQYMLFPLDSSLAARWFKIVQHTSQANFYKDHELDILILGRRKQDGNYVGKEAGSNIYTNSEGITRYSPLADWKHEDVLGVIHYYDMPMPPIYDTVNGYVVGTGAWPARQWCKDHEQAWNELYEIDPNIVKRAATFLPEAEDFLKRKDS